MYMYAISCVICYLISVSFAALYKEAFFTWLMSCQGRKHSCNSQEKLTYCNCDRLCIYYDDCCFDANEISKVRTEVDKSPIPFPGETTCEYTSFNELENSPFSRGAWMVSACPAAWKGDINVKFKCEKDIDRDLLDLLPVFDISTGVTFKNRQCALCHNVNEFIPWLLKLRCSKDFYKFEILSTPLLLNDAMMLRLKSRYCEYRFEPSSPMKVRYCYHEIEYVLWNALKEVNSTSCRNRVMGPIWMKQSRKGPMEMFRNVHCLFDDFGVPDLNNDTLVCFFSGRDSDFRDQTISSLIDVSALFYNHDSTRYCSKTEIHLSDKIGCQTLYCPTDMEPSEGRCVAIKYNSASILLDLLFETNMPVAVGNTYFNIFNDLFNKMKLKLKSKLRLSSDERILEMKIAAKIIPGYHVTSMEPCSLIHTQNTLKGSHISNASSEYIRTLVTKLFAHYYQNVSYGTYVKHINDIEESLCEYNVSVRNPLYVANRLSHGDVSPCPAVKVYPYGNDSDSNYSNNSVSNGNIKQKVFYLNSTLIESEDVSFKHGNYFLCIDTYLSKYQVENEKDVSMTYYRYIMNTICTCLSMASLAYSLTQYCIIPFMREGKSELIFVLMLYLFFAQTSFLLMAHIEVANDWCEWFGMLHHFVWIGSFIFMFLCPYRLNSDIRTLATFSSSERCSRTGKYGLIGFMLNFSIVVSTKILNSVLAPSETWYGGNICFITHVHVLLFAFILPISLLLCGNIILFILIIHYVKTTSIPNNNNSNKSKIFLLIKISSILGFSWIIGIIATFVQSEIFLVIFENISSLQGLFIAISLSCNNRVYKFYSDQFCQTQNT